MTSAQEDRSTGRAPVVCYVVLCHDDAPAALSLVGAIRATSPHAQVLLRHDQPVGYLDGEDADAVGATLLRSRIRVTWGGWSLVEAMLEASAHAVDVLEADLVVLVSGRDRPVRHLGRWEEELLDTGVDALLDVDPSPDPARHLYRWATWQRPRVVPRLVGRLGRRLWQRGPARWQRRVLAYPTSRDGVWAIGLRLRHDPVAALGLRYIKGSQWMVLSAAAVRAATDQRTAVARRVFARTRIPDESYVQSVVSADPDLRTRRGRTTYTVFPPGSASPRDLRAADVPAAVASGAAFARKIPAGAAGRAVVTACDAAARP
ncbi:hypothetical protein WDZ16_03790 [Pseudokineococcus marinus]|uniref:Core-2/I-Branching enzyme n=1 Tax=Pseudokineococcus marinus TaxID=351215 RepID=A0A849BMQ4_9ACTN|nr:hypothetical protein [Pseudokineococcus marinus]NNH21894.1 hypothetical protein [Pseudokineococcus marinus]